VLHVARAGILAAAAALLLSFGTGRGIEAIAVRLRAQGDAV
jgi:hypothetical protein